MKSIVAVCFAAALALYSCKDTPYPVDEPVVKLQADLSQKILTPIGVAADTNRIDTLLASSVKILVRNVQLHRELTAPGVGYVPLVSGPYILTVPAGAPYSATPFPIGNYDGMAVELTRLTDAEAQQYASDAQFADFVTAERLSFVMEGTLFKKGAWQPFRLTADTLAPVVLQFDSPIGVPKGSSTDLLLVVDLSKMLLFGKEIIDPLAKGNAALLEGRVVDGLRVMKRDR